MAEYRKCPPEDPNPLAHPDFYSCKHCLVTHGYNGPCKYRESKNAKPPARREHTKAEMSEFFMHQFPGKDCSQYVNDNF